MTSAQPILEKRPLVRWSVVALAFLGAGLASSAVMRLLLDRCESMGALPTAFLFALGGGFVAWIAFRILRQQHLLLCAAIMGLCSGVAGAGGVVLLGQLFSALSPAGGITSNVP
jgi:hypothetical protein